MTNHTFTVKAHGHSFDVEYDSHLRVMRIMGTLLDLSNQPDLVSEALQTILENAGESFGSTRLEELSAAYWKGHDVGKTNARNDDSVLAKTYNRGFKAGEAQAIEDSKVQDANMIFSKGRARGAAEVKTKIEEAYRRGREDERHPLLAKLGLCYYRHPNEELD